MSKSYGNVVDPLDWIDAYGADAMRFTLLRAPTPAATSRSARSGSQGSRNFCNKLWNATRFALIDGATVEGEPPPAGDRSCPTVGSCRGPRRSPPTSTGFERFEFAKGPEAPPLRLGRVLRLVPRTRQGLADWRHEADAPAVLGDVLEGGAAAAAPVMPFVTEELWTGTDRRRNHRRRGLAGRRTGSRRPVAQRSSRRPRIVTEVRRFRADQGVKPGGRVAAPGWTGPTTGLAATRRRYAPWPASTGPPTTSQPRRPSRGRA